jgi:hypothetical protein
MSTAGLSQTRLSWQRPSCPIWVIGVSRFPVTRRIKVVDHRVTISSHSVPSIPSPSQAVSSQSTT